MHANKMLNKIIRLSCIFNSQGDNLAISQCLWWWQPCTIVLSITPVSWDSLTVGNVPRGCRQPNQAMCQHWYSLGLQVIISPHRLLCPLGSFNSCDFIHSQVASRVPILETKQSIFKLHKPLCSFMGFTKETVIRKDQIVLINKKKDNICHIS